MATYAIKILVSVTVILLAAEIAKRSPAWGALIISLPLISILSMSFLYYDTKNVQGVVDLARSIPLALIPSVVFFFGFVLLAKLQMPFIITLFLACVLMMGSYGIYLYFIK